jgi:hypothetical protein
MAGSDRLPGIFSLLHSVTLFAHAVSLSGPGEQVDDIFRKLDRLLVGPKAGNSILN